MAIDLSLIMPFDVLHLKFFYHQCLTTICYLKCHAFVFILMAFGLYACNDNQEGLQKGKMGAILDTLKSQKAIAIFEEDEALCFITPIKNLSSMYLKIVCRENFPAYIDTLYKTTDTSYLSKRFGGEYVLHDSTVTYHYIEHMVHPCYTWQGQAPVGRKMVLKHKRYVK